MDRSLWRSATSTLTADHLQIAVVEWQQAGVAPQTIKHRRRALSQLIERLDGRSAPNPCRDVTIPRIAHPDPRPTAKRVIVAVAENLKHGDAKTYARFLVLLYTMTRPVELMRATPDDVWLGRQLWYVREAKGCEPRTVPLTPDAVRAWEAFIAADAWGSYDTSRHAKRLHRAGWPVDERPYNLRHTGAMAILEHGSDLSDVQGILGHKSIDTTARDLRQAQPRAVAESRQQTEDRPGGTLMALLLGKVYQALRMAEGVSDETAREAAEELAGYDARLAAVESQLRLLTWMVGTNIVFTFIILGLVVQIVGRLP